ncbi:MAG: hypothetical protein CMB80_19800 [Flammeovirgaceae bacterium]|nr:hypothetical protein [Flammeovirgaceae bacterium]MBE61226.1 hypothetical protein [Flammeovirgaceae bacterium]MBR10378.1 hypothetical protein [Rickettsiales bacterium]|tara:strand:- start:51 stop:623 length:573 start_codon:yes stop_codon:yes gene_type:complete
MKYKNLLSLTAAFLIGTASVFATGTEKEKESGNSYTFANNPFNSLATNSYKYNTAVGIRGLGTSGLTIKHFTRANRAVEGIVGFYPDAFSVTVLLENYVNAFDQAGLNWYYGFGGHIATETDWVYYENYRGYRRSDGDFGIGIDGIFGIEYKINEVPIAVSLDVKPFLEVTTSGNAYLAVDPGLGIKVAF